VPTLVTASAFAVHDDFSGEVVDRVRRAHHEHAADGREHGLDGDLRAEHRPGGDRGGAKAPQHPALPVRGEVRRDHDEPDGRGGREQVQHLPHLHALGQVRLLELAADTAAELLRVGERVHAEDPHDPAVRPAQPREARDGRGLAGAVRAQQAEDLAAPHLEGDVLHRDGVAVHLVQPVDAHALVR